MSQLCVDPSRGLITVSPVGSLTEHAFQDLIRAMLLHPEFRAGMSSLWDLRGCDISGLEADGMRRLRVFQEVDGHRRGHARVAFVAADDVTFGLARMFSVLGGPEHLEIRVFREASDAVTWLGEVAETERAAVSGGAFDPFGPPRPGFRSWSRSGRWQTDSTV